MPVWRGNLQFRRNPPISPGPLARQSISRRRAQHPLEAGDMAAAAERSAGATLRDPHRPCCRTVAKPPSASTRRRSAADFELGVGSRLLTSPAAQAASRSSAPISTAARASRLRAPRIFSSVGAVAGHAADRGQRLQMSAPASGGDRSRKTRSTGARRSPYNRPARQGARTGSRCAQALDLAVGDGDALAKTGRAQLFALGEAGEDRRRVRARAVAPARLASCCSSERLLPPDRPVLIASKSRKSASCIGTRPSDAGQRTPAAF